MNTLTRKELKLLVALLGGADAVRKMIPNFHTDSDWRDAKHPGSTFGQWEALINILGVQNTQDVLTGKKFVELKDADLLDRTFSPLSDEHALVYIIEKMSRAKMCIEMWPVNIIKKWRELARDMGYTGPVLWLVKAGFTLKKHAPFADHCHEHFKFLQDWELKNDEPTADCAVFFIPRIIATGKNIEEQKQALAELRTKYDLPTSHLNSFGSAVLVSGLILAHFRCMGERAPLNAEWVRTNTLYSDGRRLSLGDFGESGLRCDYYWSDDRNGSLGVFPLGVEMGF